VKNLPLLFLVLTALILVILIVYVAASVPQEQEEEPQEEIKECEDGETRDCMKGPCNGTQSCVAGSWGECIIERVCEPGEVVPCTVDSCAYAYKVCNDCGTGYGPCIGKD
jgi:hypothetical protein